MKGIILKNQNGYFTILGDNQQLSLCRSRGSLKRKSDILVGDWVDYDINQGTQALITHVYSRKNILSRPPVANIDQLILVAAIEKPTLNYFLLDKMIISAELLGMRPIICINKCDLNMPLARTVSEEYQKIGYDTVYTSTYEDIGLSNLEMLIKGMVSVFSGSSGVGKSSLLNHFLGEEYFSSGEVSSHTEKGKNTTKHAELVMLKKGIFLMDTPGYSFLELSIDIQERIDYLFPEFVPFLNQCKFHDCRHMTEPSCSIRNAVEDGTILERRYESYLRIVKNQEKNKD